MARSPEVGFPRNSHNCLGYTIGVLQRSNQMSGKTASMQICMPPLSKKQIFQQEQLSLLQILSKPVHKV